MLPSMSECSAEFNVSYQSWLFTPPSIVASESREELLVSPLHHCPVLQEEENDCEEDQSATLPLLIHVRRTRVLLFVTTFVTLLLTLIGMFAHGVALVTIEGSVNEEERSKLVEKYNFYSGTTSSFVVKPFDMCANLLLPVVYFVFATKMCLYNDSLKWNAAVMVLQALFVTMLTSALSSLNVQQRQPRINPIVIDADLFTVMSSAPSTQAQSADPFALRPTTDTILSTAMQSTYVKTGKNQCENPGRWLQTAVTHSISSNPWLKDMLPNGREPLKSVEVTVGQVLSEDKKKTSTTTGRSPLPFQMMTARNLLLHAMMNSEAILPWDQTTGMVNSTYDQFLVNAANLNATNDEEGFLYAASLMLNKSLSAQATTLNFSAAEATLNFSRFELSSDIVFDCVTIDIPSQEKLVERKLQVKLSGGLTQVLEPNSRKRKASQNAVYDVSMAEECGVDACLVEDPFFKDDLAQGTRRATPQIQAFAPCGFGSDGSEDITYNYLHGEDCKQQLNTSILIYSVAKRIVAEDMVLNSSDKHPENWMGSFINIRRYQTITMGRLSWKTQDLASRFNAYCRADQGDCRGLSYQLEGNTSRYLVVGERHLPLDALGPFMGPRSQWTPLVMLTSSVESDLLFKRNVKNNANWTIEEEKISGAMCSDAVESFARQINGNHWYMEYGVQEAYTAALFFLFQNAALREERQRVDKVQTLNFAGSHVEFTLEAKIPLQSAIVSICGSVLLLLSVFVVVIISKRQERGALRDGGGMDAHRVAKVLLVEQSFPKVFLQCTLDGPHTRGRKKPLENFEIQSLSLKQLGYCHRTGVESSAAAVSAAWQSAVIHLPPPLPPRKAAATTAFGFV